MTKSKNPKNPKKPSVADVVRETTKEKLAGQVTTKPENDEKLYEDRSLEAHFERLCEQRFKLDQQISLLVAERKGLTIAIDIARDGISEKKIGFGPLSAMSVKHFQKVLLNRGYFASDVAPRPKSDGVDTPRPAGSGVGVGADAPCFYADTDDLYQARLAALETIETVAAKIKAQTARIDAIETSVSNVVSRVRAVVHGTNIGVDGSGGGGVGPGAIASMLAGGPPKLSDAAPTAFAGHADGGLGALKQAAARLRAEVESTSPFVRRAAYPRPVDVLAARAGFEPVGGDARNPDRTFVVDPTDADKVMEVEIKAAPKKTKAATRFELHNAIIAVLNRVSEPKKFTAIQRALILVGVRFKRNDLATALRAMRSAGRIIRRNDGGYVPLPS